MCGIAGILSLDTTHGADALTAAVTRMGNALIARGPDDGDVWVDAAQGIALAHRRLAIIDLTREGHQPMHSASGRYVLSYNGEIYNYRELRAQLNVTWRGGSDTEVLLAAIEAWGIEKTLVACNGMFAFALWDTHTHTLTIARDRMGEKPLYYGRVGTQIVFASELKAFRELPGWAPSINRDAMHMFMRYSCIPAPYSVYEGIHKLPPATYLSISTTRHEAQPTPYWSLTDLVATSTANRFGGTATDALDTLDTHLKFAVGQRMMADVPLGAFLSGGIDSSLITALMQAQSRRPVETFTIGFGEASFNEAPYAKAIAAHLGTAHHELYVSAADAAAVIPQLPTIYDEPFADASQIPTYLVAKFARRHVTVALSGDGGDELFGGYNRHTRGPALWGTLSAVPLALRKAAARLLLSAHDAFVHRCVPQGDGRVGRLVRKLGNYYETMGAASLADFYQKLCSIHAHPERVVHGRVVGPLACTPPMPTLNTAEWMMLQDALTYFPSDILTKVDRAAMAVSLETRTPFTDPALMAFAWHLPPTMKIHHGQGKWVLRQLLARYVPTALTDRPKAGFAVPIGDWLRGDLNAWAADLLAPDSMRAQGFFDTQAVGEIWRMHQSGQRDLEKPLWNILMFQSWLANNS